MKKYLVVLIILPLTILCLLTGLWLIASFIEWDFRQFPIKNLDGETIRVIILSDLFISFVIFRLFNDTSGEND